MSRVIKLLFCMMIFNGCSFLVVNNINNAVVALRQSGIGTFAGNSATLSEGNGAAPGTIQFAESTRSLLKDVVKGTEKLSRAVSPDRLEHTFGQIQEFVTREMDSIL